MWEYVSGLASVGHHMYLHSFERDAAAVIPPSPARVRWFPHSEGARYLGRPPVRLLRETAASQEHLLHARGMLPAAAAVVVRHPNWIWDMRAFWREQRIALGALQPGSATERVLRWAEDQAVKRSSGIISLTEAAVDELVGRYGPSVRDKTVVVPTAVDTELFRPRVGLRKGVVRRIILNGSFNAFYDGPALGKIIDEMRRRSSWEVLWVGADPMSPWFDELSRRSDHLIYSAVPSQVATLSAEADVGLAVCRRDAGPALLAAMPTKIGELLASGSPVLVNRGLGDMDALIEKYQCGVALEDSSDAAVAKACDSILELLSDPGTSERCRSCAVSHFSLGSGVDAISALYERLAAADGRSALAGSGR
ncbi:glycosyltransferase [Rhabdothermincola salaria]|uniref:glycosyltransferase n=1 Tax=Rhabdothermincola salaria TaxID=2903142 RepID=UPI003211B4CF